MLTVENFDFLITFWSHFDHILITFWSHLGIVSIHKNELFKVFVCKSTSSALQNVLIFIVTYDRDLFTILRESLFDSKFTEGLGKVGRIWRRHVVESWTSSRPATKLKPIDIYGRR